MRALRASLAVLATALALPGALAGRGDSQCRSEVCVSAMLEGDMITYEMTAMRQPFGWIAIGFGERMYGSHMVIMWNNPDGTTTLSQRFAMTYKEPKLVKAPPRIAKTVGLVNQAHPKATTTLAFQIPANQTQLQGSDHIENLIYAYSPVVPDSSDPANHIQHHQYVGHLTLDFKKDFKLNPLLLASTSTKNTHIITQGTHMHLTRNEKVMVLHAGLVTLGFMVLLPLGSLIGRWGRAFTPKWFRAHWMVNMCTAGPVITLGVLLGPVIVYGKETYRSHFMNAHEVCGILLLALYWAQVFLGRYIHARRVQLAEKGPITRPHPPLNIVHICLGVSIIGLSFFQIRSGLQWWEILTGRGPLTSWALPLWKTWIVVLPLGYFGGYALLPRQLRQEKAAAAYAPIPADLQAQRTHLLREEDDA